MLDWTRQAPESWPALEGHREAWHVQVVSGFVALPTRMQHFFIVLLSQFIVNIYNLVEIKHRFHCVTSISIPITISRLNLNKLFYQKLIATMVAWRDAEINRCDERGAAPTYGEGWYISNIYLVTQTKANTYNRSYKKCIKNIQNTWKDIEVEDLKYMYGMS